VSALSPVLRPLADGAVAFWCPGCATAHVIQPSIWKWDGNAERPTFSPSVMLRSGHYVEPGPPCWCTYNAEHPDDPAPFKCTVCHSYVRDGQIQFLGDCTHSLAGQTVPLPSWPEEATP
jgi:Family of unknown function (DUF6527)